MLTTDQLILALKWTGCRGLSPLETSVQQALDLVGKQLHWDLADNLDPELGLARVPSISQLRTFHRFAMLLAAAERVNGLKNIESSLVDRQTRWLNRDTLSELLTAVAIQDCGVCTFVPATKRKTPDLELRLPGGDVLDVEVRRADAKADHVAQSRAASTLHQVLRGIRQHLWICVDRTDAVDDADDLLEVAQRIKPGEEVVGAAGTWSMQCFDGTAMSVVPKRPERWADDMPTIPVIFGGDVSMDVETGHPLESFFRGIAYRPTFHHYLNQFLEKAARPQCRPGHPFVIAIDVTSLPSGLRWYAEQAPSALATFPDVAAVMVMSSSDARTWQTEIVVKNNPAVQTPEGLTRALASIKERIAY